MAKPFLFAGGGRKGAAKATGAAAAGTEAAGADAPMAAPWLVLVVDDDEEVHSVTRLAIGRLRYKDRRVRLLAAHSAAEAREVLAATPDVAVILLDVVMETDDAGLRLARWIREDLNNRSVRIILRTGQPGQAPEEQVIVDYDINDYKEKTELTSQKLFTTVVTALRSYDDIVTLTLTRQGLEKVIESTASLFRKRSLTLFAEGVLTQISALLGVGTGGVLCVRDAHSRAGARPEDGLVVLAASGRFAGTENQPLRGAVEDEVVDTIVDVLHAGRPRFERQRLTVNLEAPNGRTVIVHLDSDRPLRDIDRRLIEAFSTNICAGFDNLLVMDQLRRASRAIVAAIAEVAEHWASDGARHVLTVGRLSVEIATEMARTGANPAIDQALIEGLSGAAVLHDIGKLAVPRAILGKEGPLTSDERAIVRCHTGAGAAVIDRAMRLAPSNDQLAIAAAVVRHHHEHFDGRGYPDGLAGESIPLAARIVAVADVFDALTSRLSYKEAWPVDRAADFIRAQRGTQFDPAVVDALLAVLYPPGDRPLAEWSPDLDIGVPELDEEHRALLVAINHLAAADRRHSRVVIEGVLDELVTYTNSHFAREEAFLNELGFPDAERHARLHRALADEVLEIRTRFLEGFTVTVGDRVLRFLVNWWRGHILGEDMRYAEFAAVRRQGHLWARLAPEGVGRPLSGGGDDASPGDGGDDASPGDGGLAP